MKILFLYMHLCNWNQLSTYIYICTYVIEINKSQKIKQS